MITKEQLQKETAKLKSTLTNIKCRIEKAGHLASVKYVREAETEIERILWGGEMASLTVSVEFLTEIAEELLDTFYQNVNLSDYLDMKEQLKSIKKIVNK